MNNLFSEIKINGIKVKNRIVMPPMVCFGGSDDSGQVTTEHVEHYEKRAKGGCGLIVLEACAVNSDGRLDGSQLGIWSDDHTEGLSKIAEACHRHGAVVVAQIHHAGLKTPSSITENIVAPSANTNARELTILEIQNIQEEFKAAALRAEKAGFDGIELHGSHGYLINQFVSPIANKRLDQYGDTFDNRMRFATEVISKIKLSVKDSFIVGYRMGGNEPTTQDGIEVAKALERAGVHYLHVSSGIWEGEHPVPPEGLDYNWITGLGIEIHKHVKLPVITVNGIRTPEAAAYLVENNLTDLVAIGRGQLSDSNWASKAKYSYNINLCKQCVKCGWLSVKSKCPNYLNQ